jgi:hypothetical protein
MYSGTFSLNKRLYICPYTIPHSFFGIKRGRTSPHTKTQRQKPGHSPAAGPKYIPFGIYPKFE